MTYHSRYTQKKFEADYGNYIARERRESRSIGLYRPQPGQRYCEAGEHYVARKPGKVNKGWRCEQCSSISEKQ